MRTLAILLSIFVAATALLGYEYLQASARADALSATFAVREVAHGVFVDSLEAQIVVRESTIVVQKAAIAHDVQMADSAAVAADSVAVRIVEVADTATVRLFAAYRAAVTEQLTNLRGAIARADTIMVLLENNNSSLRTELGAERALRLEAQAVAVAQARARRVGPVGWVVRGLAIYGGVKLAQLLLGGR